jgi:[ribosomal protein S5]-alanine N-acetyltransferase
MTEEYKFKEMDTDRLRLIKLSQEHGEDMYAYASCEETVRYMSWPSHGSPEQTARFIDLAQELYEGEMHYDWAIWHRKDKKMIGTIGLHGLDRDNNGAEMGFIIAKSYWGMGLVHESAQRLLRFCFEEMDFSLMKAYCDPDNHGSERVLEKLGMTYGGLVPYQLMKQPDPVEYKYYFIKKDEF